MTLADIFITAGLMASPIIIAFAAKELDDRRRKRQEGRERARRALEKYQQEAQEAYEKWRGL